MSEARADASRWLVFASGMALVGSVWVSLELSRRLPAEGDEGQAATRIRMPTAAVPGFLPELAYMPDEGQLGFVEVPAGPFVMGSDPAVDSLAFEVEQWEEGRPLGTLELPLFWMGRYEVTVAQYAAFIASAGYRLADPRALEGRPDHPVTWVSWTDALEYARWLDGTLRESSSTPDELAALLAEGWSVSLPTEAQWEKAARGPDGRIYPWGEDARLDRAHYRARGTAAVGSLRCPECPYGLSDMSGNVWEWTRSPYQPYPYDSSDDRNDLDEDALWVMRGGSFSDTEQFIRTANRGGADPGARRAFIGFRIVLSPT
jgi:formylglycine-generating enzyme required for sulfatase activity